ncbi:MAG: hypothetical protein OEY85_02070 [Rhodospirillales bacterium]|nr:hypothetical protein [Rhodospirillales bacterium]
MTFSGTILMGAQARLLDPTIPYRYFAAALGFHVLLWGLIAIFPGDVAVFAGGPGPALAALHSLTLGVLTMTAMGASLQMLPVATGIPLRSTRSARVVSWFFIPGTVILIWGMAESEHIAMALGGFGVTIGLVVFLVLITEVLWRARAFKPLARFGLTAMSALVLALALGLVLIMDNDHGFLDDRIAVISIHVIFAGFGFMGMLALGFSHLLIPLFALSEGVPTGESGAAFAFSMLGLAAGIVGIYYGLPVLAAAGALAGLFAAALHVRAMRRCLANGMRKNLGVAGKLMRVGWGFLILGLITALLTATGFGGTHGPRLFVFFALFGWLLTFLLGVLQRIIPFLGSMNAARAGASAPRPSELAPDNLLNAQALLHALALILTGAGIAMEAALPVRAGGIVGLLGAMIYAVFAFRVWWMIHGRPRATIKKERP